VKHAVERGNGFKFETGSRETLASQEMKYPLMDARVERVPS
jgi:hypothetical protein